MNENEMMQGNAPTDEEIAEMEALRKAEEDARLEPYRAAARQRAENARIVAEHDEALVEILFEITMMAFGEEV